MCGMNLVEDNGKCMCKYPSVYINGKCIARYNIIKKCPDFNMIQTNKNNQQVCECKSGYSQFKNSCIACPDSLIFNN